MHHLEVHAIPRFGGEQGPPRPQAVSRNHYIVYSLTRLMTASDLEGQRQKFEELTSPFPPEKAQAALRELLAAREP